MLAFLVATAIAITRIHHLFAAAMLSGLYSLITASLFVVMDAVDVAFTEAAVGAGISTILMLSTLALTRGNEKVSRKSRVPAMLVVLLTGAGLILATTDMPHYGSATAPVHKHVAPRYLNQSATEVGPPNVVTSVLASYRGYDTLGEVVVIFSAGVVVMSLLGRRRRGQHGAGDDKTMEGP